MAQKIGDIDLDTLKAQYSVEMFNRKVERMQKVVSGADKQMSQWQRTWNGLARVAGAFGVALGIGGVVNYIASLRNLNKEINETRSGLRAGSNEAAEFNAAVGGASDEQAAKINRMTMAIDRARLSLKKFVANWIEQIAEGQTQKGSWLDQIADFFTPAADKAAMALTSPTLEGDGRKDTYSEILALEDELAALQSVQTSGLEDRLAILEKELEIERKKVELAKNTEDPNARQIINESIAKQGEITKQIKEANFQREQQNRAAKAGLDAKNAEISGQSKLAKMIEIRAKYEGQIAEAEKAQNTELANILRQQQAIEEAEVRRAAHKMTPRERLKERQVARKLAREKRQTDAAEAEFQNRWNRGIRPTTPGSEFDQWSKRKGFFNVAPAAQDPKLATEQQALKLWQSMSADMRVTAKALTE